jgi:hypothetical protein
MLGTFFDDSGTHSTSPVVAIGGLVGTEKQQRLGPRYWSNHRMQRCRRSCNRLRRYPRIGRRDPVTPHMAITDTLPKPPLLCLTALPWSALRRLSSCEDQANPRAGFALAASAEAQPFICSPEQNEQSTLLR